MITKLTTVACIAAATVLTVVASASSAGSRQPNHADARSRPATPANLATHFAGFPAVGVKPSTPTAGRLVIGLEFQATAYTSTEWYVYADGRIIWQRWTVSGAAVIPAGATRLDTAYVQQRLTRQGVQLLQSKILATGLFDHDLKLTLPGHQVRVFSYQVRVGDRMVTVQGSSGSGQTSPDPTPAQTNALAWIAALVAHPARWLPASAWADRQIRAFVPACYQIAFDDRPYPDLAKLPPPAGKALAQYKQLERNQSQSVRTRQARALLQALAKAGIAPDENSAREIYFHLGQLPGQPHPAGFWLSPALPNECF